MGFLDNLFGEEKKKKRKKKPISKTKSKKIKKKNIKPVKTKKVTKKIKKKPIKKIKQVNSKKLAKKIKKIKKKNIKPVKTKKVTKKIKKKIVKKPIKQIQEIPITNTKFNSSREVTGYYKKEKEKLDNFLNEMQKKKAESYIDVVNKKLAQVMHKKKGLEILEHNLRLHIKKINKKIRKLSANSKKHNKNVELVTRLKGSVNKLDKEFKAILTNKRLLILKEKDLARKMNELAEKSKDRLKFSDGRNSRKFLQNERKKQVLIEESKELISKEAAKILEDGFLLDSIKGKAAKGISKIHKDLRELEKEKLKILEELHLVEISEKKAEKEVVRYLQKVENLRIKYKQELGYK